MFLSLYLYLCFSLSERATFCRVVFLSVGSAQKQKKMKTRRKIVNWQVDEEGWTCFIHAEQREREITRVSRVCMFVCVWERKVKKWESFPNEIRSRQANETKWMKLRMLHVYTSSQKFDTIRLLRYNKYLKKINHIKDVKNIHFA